MNVRIGPVELLSDTAHCKPRDLIMGRKKNPWLAATLSIVPGFGVGYLYIGEVSTFVLILVGTLLWGVAFVVVSFGYILATFSSSGSPPLPSGVPTTFLFVLFAVNVYTAVMVWFKVSTWRYF